MESVRVTFEFGLVLRRAALLERGVELPRVLVALEVSRPLEEGSELISFGPFFGGEVQNEMGNRLGDLGLRYFDDFFELALDHPSWIRFRAEGDER